TSRYLFLLALSRIPVLSSHLIPLHLFSYRHHPDLHSFPTRRSSDLMLRSTALCHPCRSCSLFCSCICETKVTSQFHKLRISSLRSEEHTSELQSRFDLVCRLLLEKKNQILRNRAVQHSERFVLSVSN